MAIDPYELARRLGVDIGPPPPLTREQIRTQFAAFCAARPAGSKFAHRACDAPAGSSPSMKWVNPPVAYMLHAGVPLLLEAGVHLPALHPGDPRRMAWQYPQARRRRHRLRLMRLYRCDCRHRRDRDGCGAAAA